MTTSNMNYVKSHMACMALSAITLALAYIFPSARTPYLFGAPAFAITALIFSGIWLVTNFKFKQHAIANVFGVLSFAALAYALMEVFYAFVPIKLNIEVSSAAMQYFFTQLDSYIIDRSYQYIAVSSLFIGLWFAFGRELTQVLRFGDLTAKTTILGNKAPIAWKQAFMRVTFMLGTLTIAGLAIRSTLQISSGHLFLYGALLIGGFNNSLIEELVFRGLLQPAFAQQLSPEAANRLQAIIFSSVHYSYVSDGTWTPVISEITRLILYVGIGIFFGRAANETKGIGVSTLLHFLITSAIWAELTFTGPL